MLVLEILSFSFVFSIGLVVGSFLTAYTFRAPRGLSVSSGRSFCPKCKNTISWYDNIPLFSYLVLGGKCRKCGKPIPKRYPVIELATAILFLTLTVVVHSCFTGQISISVCNYWRDFGVNSISFLLLVSSLFVAVFVTDFEHQIILDEFVFVILIVSFIMTILYTPQLLFIKMLSGLLASLFLLFLHMVTKGKGMGLGDVKLALAGGFVLGWPSTLVWMAASFIIGALVGLGLIAFKMTKFGKQIAFGPFLVVSFFIALFFSDEIIRMLFSNL